MLASTHSAAPTPSATPFAPTRDVQRRDYNTRVLEYLADRSDLPAAKKMALDQLQAERQS
jgi:hypothetical protein